jgi:hypothetical protein
MLQRRNQYLRVKDYSQRIVFPLMFQLYSFAGFHRQPPELLRRDAEVLWVIYFLFIPY